MKKHFQNPYWFFSLLAAGLFFWVSSRFEPTPEQANARPPATDASPSHTFRRSASSTVTDETRNNPNARQATRGLAQPAPEAPPEHAEAQPVIEEAGFPIALTVADLDLPHCTPGEKTFLQSLKARFEAKLALAPSQDPEDPTYFDHWKKARLENDEHLRAMLGWDRYNTLSSIASSRLAGR